MINQSICMQHYQSMLLTTNHEVLRSILSLAVEIFPQFTMANLTFFLFNVSLEKIIRDADIHTKVTISYKSLHIFRF